ncbi:urease accessory protein UreF [Chelativorans sp.]|uniref:urease accessory protein UreF n=1 Tax=Chelativorans sp. TaxID=2203393 RepID=UPI0035C769CD
MPMGTATTIMTETQALQRLLAWSSPAFPVGAFAYSGGLETTIAGRRVADAQGALAWIEGNLRRGAVRNDAILAAEATRGHVDGATLGNLADLCLALTPARERYEEMLVTGEAFLAAARTWPDAVPQHLPSPCPYPIAFGAVAGMAGIAAEAMLVALLTAYVQAQISVAVRLVPIGQSDGLAILAALEPLIAEMAAALSEAGLDDLGSASYAADIAAMAHETLPTRIFRS